MKDHISLSVFFVSLQVMLSIYHGQHCICNRQDSKVEHIYPLDESVFLLWHRYGCQEDTIDSFAPVEIEQGKVAINGFDIELAERRQYAKRQEVKVEDTSVSALHVYHRKPKRRHRYH